MDAPLPRRKPARTLGASLAAAAAAAAAAAVHDAPARLRVGYVSSDFREHPVG